MHEVSICEALLAQVARLAVQHGATGVSTITLRLGPLSGVEPALLRTAYNQCRAGTCAQDADLVIVTVPVRITCQACAATGEATIERLACGTCGSADTRLVGGDEMLCESVDLVFAA
ncbi:hydrogenase maturation nickel metallochaperone HypA/HybF [Massilia niastensis]|uniref:hydrogenase maturation nickel metallochaperone HypA/HybF n=1 Tax=Massilia niastensis TaxID=544911 RepID=UPI000372B785|nr:hydrogenase maturation nickel metallochaperone HypA [Massilia niastensis]